MSREFENDPYDTYDVYNVESMDESIELVSWDDVPERFKSPTIYEDSPYGTGRRIEFREWLSEQRIYYYSRPRESFSQPDAEQRCRAAGMTRLLLEDLS